MKWMGFEINSKYLIEVEECCACREKIPVDQLPGNGMCQRCTDIENNLLERLAGKWGQMVIEEENARYNSEIMRRLRQNAESEKRNGWSSWL